MSTRERNRLDQKRPRVVMLVIALAMLGAAKPKAKPAAAKPEPAAGPELPKDLNLASLRVHAVDTLYELDLSPEQLGKLKAVAKETASKQKRTAAAPSADEKLSSAMNDFYRSLLSHQEDQDIAKLRNQLTELSADDAVHLDDEVEATDAARAKAPEICRQFSPGQIAAYLASHADEMTDPDEKMVTLLAELHDLTTAEGEELVSDTGDEIGRLIAGQDKPKAAAVTARIKDWWKVNRELTEEQLVTQHTALLSSAKKVLGDVSPIEILGHWMEEETANLLANPQLPEAIEAVLAASDREQ